MDEALDVLLSNARSLNAHTGKVYGVVPARVLRVFDASGHKYHLLGMVQVWFPWLQSQDDPNLISPWARLCTPAGGRGYIENQTPNAFDNASTKEGAGLYAPPTVGDEVLVGFEHGDIHHPYVLGTLWNGVDKIPIVTDVTGCFNVNDSVKGPDGSRLDCDTGGNSHAAILVPELAKKEKVGEKEGPNANKLWFWRSRSGHIVIFDDSQEHPKVVITTASGKERIVLDEKKHKVQIASGYTACSTPDMHSPQHRPHTCVPREPLEGDGALGDQETGSGDDVDGGDVEILAKNRLWIKARKIDVISSHNTNVEVGNLFRVSTRGKLTLISGLNLTLQSKRALSYEIGYPPVSEVQPPKNAPNTPLTPMKPGQWGVKTSGSIAIESQGLPTVGTKDITIKAFPQGSVDVTAFKDFSIKSFTGDTSLKTLTGSTQIFSLKGVSTTSATGAIDEKSQGGISGTTAGCVTNSAAGAMTVTSGAMVSQTAPLIKLN